jgi:hypothetical protein
MATEGNKATEGDKGDERKRSVNILASVVVLVGVLVSSTNVWVAYIQKDKEREALPVRPPSTSCAAFGADGLTQGGFVCIGNLAVTRNGTQQVIVGTLDSSKPGWNIYVLDDTALYNKGPDQPLHLGIPR